MTGSEPMTFGMTNALLNNLYSGWLKYDSILIQADHILENLPESYNSCNGQAYFSA